MLVRETSEGLIDIKQLTAELKNIRNLFPLTQIIGCFSAASNVTGVLSDVSGITELLHSFNALSFWDYACAAPYVRLEMNPVISKGAYKDAIYFSGHKFVGGPGTPGITKAFHDDFDYILIFCYFQVFWL